MGTLMFTFIILNGFKEDLQVMDRNTCKASGLTYFMIVCCAYAFFIVEYGRVVDHHANYKVSYRLCVIENAR